MTTIMLFFQDSLHALFCFFNLSREIGVVVAVA